jgi:hypothetical protein
MRAGETQLAKALLHLRHRHEQFPQQAATIILDHHHNRTLVDGEAGVSAVQPRDSLKASVKP